MGDGPEGWDVMRDAAGNAITLTPEQVQAVWHAIYVVERVRASEGYDSLWTNPQPNLGKSRLLGRMLVDGRPPLAEKPPHWVAGCGYHLVEGVEVGHYYFGSTPLPVTISNDGTVVIDPEDPRASLSGPVT